MTELVFILDRSGSMYGLEQDTIGSFNSMIEKQRKVKGEKAFVSTLLFNNNINVLYDRVPIDKVKEITDKYFNNGGATALLDAIGGAIHHIGNIHKYARKEDVPKKTIFVIITDAMKLPVQIIPMIK